MDSNPQIIPVREKIAYGLGDTATNLVWRTLMVFLPFFYTDVFGISAAAVGTLLLVSRYGDGISDFLMGILADRSNSRWGKFRPWVLFTAVPFGVLTVLTFGIYIDQSTCIDKEIRSIDNAFFQKYFPMYFLILKLIVGCTCNYLTFKSVYSLVIDCSAKST